MTRTRTPFTAADDGLLRAHVRRHGHQGQSGNEIYKQLAEQHPHHTWHSWRQRWVKRLAPMEQAEQNRRARLQQLNRVAASAAAAPTVSASARPPSSSSSSTAPAPPQASVPSTATLVAATATATATTTTTTTTARSVNASRAENLEMASHLRRLASVGATPTMTAVITTAAATTATALPTSAARYPNESAPPVIVDDSDSERFDLVAPQGKRARRAPTAAATTAEAAREPPAFNRAVPLRTDPLDFGQYVGDLCRVTGALQTECVRILAATCNNLDLGPAAVRWWRRHCTTLDPQGTDVAAEDEAVEQTWPIACWTPRRDILLQSSTSPEELKGLAIELGNEIVALFKWDVAAGGGDNEALARRLNAFLGRSEPYRKALNLVSYSDDDDDDDDDSSSSSNDQDQHMPQAYDLGIHAISLRLLFIDLARQHKWSHLVTLHS